MSNYSDINKMLKNEKLPQILSQEEVVQESLEYIKNRKSGKYLLLKTPWKLLNYIIGGGFETNTTITISGQSGGGKSTLSKRLMHSFINSLGKDQNGEYKSIALSFNFEMLAHKTVGREISNLSKTSLNEIYSKTGQVNETLLKNIETEFLPKLKELPIMYVEEPQSYDVIDKIVRSIYDNLCKGKDKTLIVELDHTLLTKGKEKEDAKLKIDSLMEVFNGIKKYVARTKGNIVFIVLTQMNRDIKSTERITNPVQHIPMTSDIFQSSTVEFYSDYIIIAHNPSKLNLQFYTQNKYPVHMQHDGKLKEIVYFHVLKNRDGESDKVLPMLANFETFDFIEIDKNDFNKK